MGQVKGPSPKPAFEFATFGEALKFSRRRAQLSQEELARAVGFSREQITKLENNQRTADPVTVRALFLPALDLRSDSELAAKLVELASRRRGPSRMTAQEFEPPRSNLAAPLTHFIGRTQQVSEIERLLETTRFLTLTGAGGVGKTRLATQVGLDLLEKFSDGVWFVELAPIHDPELVAETVAGVLNLPWTVARQVSLSDYLRPKEMLLVLDNCEHLLVACARLAESLLRAAPNLHILATSRESLGVLSATTYRVPSLALPDANLPLDQLAETEAVRLFLDRAALSKPDFNLTNDNAHAIVEICRRLDGVPLALELAATRVNALTVQQIADHLSDRFRLLTSGNASALPRHRTLRAMIDWSYDLLDESERKLFRHLAVFNGGCDLEAIEETSEDTDTGTIASLVDKSLVVAQERGPIKRYELLETLREYALEKLAQAQELETARKSHLVYFVSFITENEKFLRGPRQKEWYGRFDLEQDNFRAALDWAVRSGDGNAGLRMIAALWFYWFWRGHWAEGARWARTVLEVGGETDERLRGRALIGAANLTGRIGDYTTYGQWLGEGTRLAEQVGDAEALAWSRLNATFGIRDEAQVNMLLEQALEYARGAGDVWFQAEILHVWSERENGRGEGERAQELFEESERLFRAVGDQERVAVLVGNLGILAFERGDYAQAQAAFDASLIQARERNDSPGVANWLLQCAVLALKLNDPPRVMSALAECMPIFLDVDDQEAIADCFVIAAELANVQDQSPRAAMLLGAADQILQRFNLLHQVVSPTKYAKFERDLNETKARLADGEFRAAWERGRTLSLQGAIAFALDAP